MELHPVDIVISLINIAVLFILLRLILWKYVINFLSKRSAKIRSDMDEAAKNREDAEAIHNEYTKKLAELEDKGAEIVRQSKLKANEESDKILQNTKAEVSEMISEAHTRIERDKKQALDDAHDSVAQLATEMAARILDREVKQSDNTHAVDEFFSEVNDE